MDACLVVHLGVEWKMASTLQTQKHILFVKTITIHEFLLKYLNYRIPNAVPLKLKIVCQNLQIKTR